MRRIFSLVLLVAFTTAASAAPLRTAFLPFILQDTSLPSPQSKPSPADLHRLALVDQVVKQGLVRSGEYTPSDLQPIAAQIAENDLVGCSDCAVSLGRQIGAQAVVTGWVQKVSDLIIDMTIIIRSVGTGKMIAAGDVSLRGDTDIAWTRAATWLVAHRLLSPESR
ncbi:MAG TPA: DUF3280 domain-containing protein [Acetobacteraceae bacterium]|nr:DUF3280 domain-containing protein [Acetobacteraceae bacterium]